MIYNISDPPNSLFPTYKYKDKFVENTGRMLFNKRKIMGISGKLSDLKILIALFGNASIKEIIQFKELKNITNPKVT